MDRKFDDSLQILPTCTSPCLKFSEESVNTWWCHLTEDDRLVNQNSPKEQHDGKAYHYSSISSDVAMETGPRSQGLEMRSQSPFTLSSHRSLSGKGLSPFSTDVGLSGYSLKRQGRHGNSHQINTTSLPGRQSPFTMSSQDPSSGYTSPFVTSRRPPRLKIYPGALGSSGLRGLGQRYWEAEVTCDVKVHLYGLPIFEAGVSWGEAADTSGLVEGAGSSWVLRFTTCYDHPEHVCAKAQQSCRPLCHSPVRECKKNERFVVRYGFLLNFDTREFVIIDLAKREVFYVFENVDTSRDLWPVFGVFSRHRHHVAMRLVAGKDLRLDSGITGIISKLINRTILQQEPRPNKLVSPTSLKYSLLMQTA